MNKNDIKNTEIKLILIYICAIFSFILCVMLRFSVIIENCLKSIIITLLFLIPTVNSIFLIFLVKNKKIKLKIANIVQIIIIIPSIIYFCVLSFCSIFIQLSDGGVNSIKNYKRVYNYYEFDYFPKKISKNVEKTMFHYNPQFLQGGEIFSLYMKCDKNIIKEYDKKYKKYKLEDNSVEKQEIKKFNISFLYYTPYNKNYDKVDDLTFYLLYRECDESGYCNHGRIKLIAIDENSNEIIFYYENW